MAPSSSLSKKDIKPKETKHQGLEGQGCVLFSLDLLVILFMLGWSAVPKIIYVRTAGGA